MTLQQLTQRVLFETNTDADDLGDFQPHLTAYLNQGYDRLLTAFVGEHVGRRHPPMSHPKARPELPEWAHGAVADYAAWQLYRCGGPSRQARGEAFRAAYEDITRRLRAEAAKATVTRFRNLP